MADAKPPPPAGGDAPGKGGKANECEEEYRLETVPFDPRFPNMNQAKHCYVNFLDYHRCMRVHGDTECKYKCEVFLKAYRSLCPNEWTAKWTEQIEKGTFAGQNKI